MSAVMTGDEAIAALPASVRIGGYDFAIRKISMHEAGSERRWGACSTQMMEITIQNQMPTAQRAVDVLFHEISHAIYWVYGCNDEDKEERVVSILGTALMALHRDNPWLAGWLSGALAE